MSYSPCDFVDDVAALVDVSEEEAAAAASALGIDADNLTDDSYFAAWSSAVLRKISEAITRGRS